MVSLAVITVGVHRDYLAWITARCIVVDRVGMSSHTVVGMCCSRSCSQTSYIFVLF